MLFVAVSGGADSTAMALLLHERGVEFEMVFADTGCELPENYWLLPRLAQYVGKPLHVVSGGGFFLWLVHKGYMLPSPRLRWCTQLLKMRPQHDFLAAQGVGTVALGIRADEPQRIRPERRSYASTAELREHKYETVYPLADAGMDKEQVLAFCRKRDLLNPVYAWRSNVSCFCCPFQRKHDWLGLLRHHPTLYAVAEAWERQSALTTLQGWGWNERFTLAALRTADVNQLRLWPEPEEQPCLICSDGPFTPDEDRLALARARQARADQAAEEARADHEADLKERRSRA